MLFFYRQNAEQILLFVQVPSNEEGKNLGEQRGQGAKETEHWLEPRQQWHKREKYLGEHQRHQVKGNQE